MAYPTPGTPVTTSFPTTTASHPVDMPPSVNAGELLKISIAVERDNFTFTTPSGWTKLWEQFDSDNSFVACADFIKIATGAEGGTQVDIVTSTAQIAVAQAQRFIKSGGFSLSDVEAGTAAESSGTSSAPDPPSITPSWGSGIDTLYIAECFASDDDENVTVAPSGYSNLTSSIAGGGTNNGATVGTATMQGDGSAEDPGTFALDAPAIWTAQTLALRGTTSEGEGDDDEVGLASPATSDEIHDLIQNRFLLLSDDVTTDVTTFAEPGDSRSAADQLLLSDSVTAVKAGSFPTTVADGLLIKDNVKATRISAGQSDFSLSDTPKYYVRSGFKTPSWTEVRSTYGTWDILAKASSWEDLSAGPVPDEDVLRISIDRGLGDAFDRMPVNDATFLFDNFHEDYSPEKNSRVRPNAILSIKAAMLDQDSSPASWYPLYTGYIKSIATDPALETKRQISFRCEDRGKQIKNKTANTSLQVNVQANSLFVQTFRAAGFSDAAFVVDERMGDVFSFAWLDDIPLGDAITRQLEAGAHFIYCDPRGSFIVKDRNFDAFASTDARSSDQFLAFRYNMDDRKIINVAEIGGEPRVLATQQATVAWLQDTDVTVNSGDMLEFDIDYRDPITEEQPTPCRFIVTPVASADWQLNSEPDNIGTDLTAFGSLIFQPFATTGRVQLTYTGSQEAYLTKLQIRATPLRKQPATTARARNTTSVEQYDEQKLEVESDLIPNVFLSQAYADFFVKRYASPDGFIEFARKDEWPDILQVDLTHFMTAVNTYSGVSSTYYVDKVRHDIALARGIEHTVVYGGRLSTERGYLVLDNDPLGKLDVRILAF